MMRRWMAIVAVLLLAACARREPARPAKPFVDVHDDRVCIASFTTDPNGEMLEYVFDFGSRLDTSEWLHSGDTARCYDMPSDTGSYSVRVMARNVSGHESKWSETSEMRLSAPPSHSDTGVYWGDEDTLWRLRPWGRDRYYIVVRGLEDDDGDSVSAKFIWGNGTETEWTPFMPSGSVLVDSVMYPTDGDHYVRLVLRDSRGTVSPPDTLVGLRVSEIALLWWTEVDCGFGTPALVQVDGQLLVVADGGATCLDRFGNVIWYEEDLCSDFACALSLDQRRLYSASDGERLACADVLTGEEYWSVNEFESTCAPAVGPNGEIYLGAYGGEVICVRDDGSSGAVEWRVDLGEGLDDEVSSVVVGTDGTVFTGMYSENPEQQVVAAISPRGLALWCDTVPPPGAHSSLPGCIALDGDGRLLLTTGFYPTYLSCYNPDGSPAWSSDATDCEWETPVAPVVRADGSAVYAGCVVACFDPCGNRVWTSDAYAYSSGACLDNCDAAYVWDCGWLTRLGADGEPAWTYVLDETLDVYFEGGRRQQRDDGLLDPAPVIGPDGNIYVSDNDYLYCLSLGRRGQAVDAPWPSFRHDPANSGWAGRQ